MVADHRVLSARASAGRGNGTTARFRPSVPERRVRTLCRVKIALTHPYSWPEVRRGAERIIMETARSLTARGHDVTVFSAGWTGGTTIEWDSRIVRFRRRWRQAARHERWFALRVIPSLLRGGFDVVHSFMPQDAVAAIRTQRFRGHRTLYDEMGVPWLMWDRLPDHRARRRVVEEIDVYACMSRFALEALHARTSRRGVQLPGGVRMDEFRPSDRRADEPTVLYSGALNVKFKGVGSLLEAVAVAAEREPHLRLWLSGPGNAAPLLASAPAAARERVRVLDLGQPEDQADRYARAWTTVLPSTGESFGMVMLESLACGTPIVTTDHGAPQELVTPATGAVATAGDVRSLADALLRALALTRDPITVDRCREAASEYDWVTAIAPLLERLYRREGSR